MGLTNTDQIKMTMFQTTNYTCTGQWSKINIFSLIMYYVPLFKLSMTSLRCMFLSFTFNSSTVKSGFQISLRKLNKSSVGLCSVYMSNCSLSSGGTPRTYAKCFQHLITLLSLSKYFESFSKRRVLSVTTFETN